MKFVCDRCQTRYTVADEKIRQRIVRIRCKNCGGVITLHAGEVIAGPQDASARHSSNLAAVPADVRASSKVSRPPVRRSEWFIAVDGVEKGPLNCAEATQYIVMLGPNRVVHVWKEGMDEWKRPEDVAIIAQELSALKRAPVKAPAADATVVTPAPVAFDVSPRPAPPKASGSAPKLPGMGAKPSPSGSAPKGAPLPSVSSDGKAAPAAPGSASKLGPAGSGPKAAPAMTGSGPKAPPPIPASHRAQAPIPGAAPRATPIAAVSIVPDARPAAKSSTYPVAKTPPPAAAPRATPIAAIKTLPDARLFAKSSTHPVVKTPPPAAAHQLKAESKPGHETSPPGATEHAPDTESGFDDEVPTSPDSRRRAAHAAKDAPSPESTPVVESTPGANDFSQSEKTPPPSQPLPPVGVTVHPVRESKNWPVVANLSFAHPPAMPEGMSAEGAMALPTPAPLAGPLFANVAELPVKSLVGHAEVGLSKLTGLAALVNKHRHLKYVAAAGLLLVLIIAVILLSWQGESGKGVGKVAEIEKKARAAALAAEPVPVPPEESEPAIAPAAEPEPSKTRAPAHASKRVPRPQAAPAPTSAKPAPVEDPFAPPAGMTRSAEKPIPLAAIQGKRAPAANEPRAVSQTQISEVVRKKENQAALKTCYERALKQDGRLRTGRLDITVSIGPMGTVQRVQVHGSADFMVIDKCLKEAIRHWRFPVSSEEYATSFPLILQGG